MSPANRAISTAGAAVLLAVAAFGGPVTLLIATALLIGAFAYGWPTLLDLPWLRGSRIVLALTGIGTLVTAYTLDAGIAALPFVIAVGLILAFISEMLRGDGRLRIVESLCGAVGGVVIVACAGGWLATAQDADGEALVIASAACLAGASAVSGALPWRGWLNVASTVLAGVLVGAGVSAVLPNIEIAHGAWAGLVAGILIAALFVLFDQVPGLRRWPAALAAIMVPVLIGGMLIYIVGAILSPTV